MLEPTGYAPNPHVAFAWLWIDGTPVTVNDMEDRPRHLQEFSVSFQVEELGRFSFTLFDPDYDFVEGLITRSKGECQFQFGYTTGRRSPIYRGYILEYVPEFLYDGIRVTLTGLLHGMDMNKETVTRAWENKPIHSIVTDIAGKYGLSPIVDATEKVESRDDPQVTDLKHATWQQHSTDWTFITESLQRQAVRQQDSAGGYVFYIDHEKNELHFHPPKYEEGPEKTFVWRNRSTEVISFSPSYRGNLLARILAGGSVQAASIDSSDGSSADGVQSAHVGTGKGVTTDPQRNKTHGADSETAWQTHRPIVKDFPDAKRAEKEAKFWWYREAWRAALGGILVVVGDPNLKPFKKYEVQVHKATGGLHWTSGLYWAKGIDHSVSGGTYLSTLKLWRSDGFTGEEANPRLS